MAKRVLCFSCFLCQFPMTHFQQCTINIKKSYFYHSVTSGRNYFPQHREVMYKSDTLFIYLLLIFTPGIKLYTIYMNHIDSIGVFIIASFPCFSNIFFLLFYLPSLLSSFSGNSFFLFRSLNPRSLSRNLIQHNVTATARTKETTLTST